MYRSKTLPEPSVADGSSRRSRHYPASVPHTIKSSLPQRQYIKAKPIEQKMLKLLAKFLRSPQDFFQDERRQRIVIISLFSLLFVCVLFSMARGAARRRSISADSGITSTPVIPEPTQTKWWIRHEPSETATSSQAILPTPIIEAGASVASSKCPAYAADFRPGTFGYISLFPPYENLIRPAAGKDYPAVGFIEVGGSVKILAEPVCTEDGYIWLNVESAADSNCWTAGGYKTAQWVLPCPDPKEKCSKNKPTESILATAEPKDNNNHGSSNNVSTCVSHKLTVGLDAQVSPNDLLVIRSEPLMGTVLGHIAPLAVVQIIDGPKCAGGAIWWEVLGTQTGWAVENNLFACPKEGECDPWKTK